MSHRLATAALRVSVPGTLNHTPHPARVLARALRLCDRRFKVSCGSI